MHETDNVIFACKSGDLVVAMLPDSSPQVTRYTDVERSIFSAR